jgi:hypothetical protein
VLAKEERVNLIKSKLNELKERRKVAMRCGVVDSIRTCLVNRNEVNDKMLKLLVQSFERIKTQHNLLALLALIIDNDKYE